MFIETSAPRVAGDKAWLVSPQFNPTKTPGCMSFWYHMFGSGVGKYYSPLLMKFTCFTKQLLKFMCDIKSFQNKIFRIKVNKVTGFYSTKLIFTPPIKSVNPLYLITIDININRYSECVCEWK